MTQFDPSMIAQMLMQPIQRASENLGGGPFGIGADAGGSYFVDPEVAARTGYGTAVTGTSFFPGAGIVDAYGGAVDVTGQPLPSFSENIREGQFTDAGLQALGVAGDIATIAAPATLGASALVGALLKAPGAIRKTTNVADVASDASKGIRVFHGTNKNIDKFELGQESASGVDSDALFFSTEKSEAKAYGTNVVEADIDLQSPLTMDFDGRSGVNFDGEYLTPSKLSKRIAEINEDLKINAIDPESELMDELRIFGFDPLVDDTIDGVIMNNISDPGRGLGDGKTTTNYMVFDTEKISMPGSDVGSIAKVEPQSLPLDKASKLERARELGFDVDNPIYHGTNTDKLTEFDESKIGSRDEGFFGRGFYFADNAGEAGYYGKNVGEYFVRGDLLDLTDTSGEPNYLGSPLVFINWAEKLDKIDMLDDTHKQALKGAKKVVKYFDENVKILPAQNADGTTGFTAKIIDPTDDGFDGDPREIFMRSRYDDGFPKTQEEAKERLFYQFADDVRTSFNKDTDFFEGFDSDFLFSLSDYIREGGDVSGLNASKLTEKAKAAGFDGVRAGDETVIFDAKNIRSSDAAFDPEKTDSPQLLSSVMQDSMTAVA